ncbi:CHRNA6 [Mytilus coruscus]|uniref:CHRNA6 n=1 Tax=Mytilus coruscus TaxID=42192 RepID=A0A6J8BQY6_MYTCO|nr:CHRNA6 [Mytilus coruscus]
MYLIVVAIEVECQTVHDIVNLYKNITNSYQKEVIPAWNQSLPFEINFGVAPLVMNSFYETEETISLTAAIYFVWNDRRLTWDPKIYGNKEHITITTNDIWIPYVYLENTVDELQPLGYDSQFYAVLSYDGNVTWTPGGILKAKCPANMLKFPFDSQTCEFVFAMWGVQVSDTMYVPMDNAGIMTYFTENSNWDITNNRQYIRYKDVITEMIFELSIKRQPVYYIVVIIVPTIMFALMNPLVFLLPVDSGERVSLGMTVLLSYAIFLTIVASSLPASSDPMCLLLFVMILIMVLSGLIVIAVIITVYYHHKDNVETINSCLLRFVTCCCCVFSSSDVSDTDGEYQEKKQQLTVKHIVKTLDVFFMIISYILLIVLLIAYLIYVILN